LSIYWISTPFYSCDFVHFYIGGDNITEKKRKIKTREIDHEKMIIQRTEKRPVSLRDIHIEETSPSHSLRETVKLTKPPEKKKSK